MYNSIVATIQARMGSTRFPGKVLKEINGIPLIQYQIEQLRRSKLLTDIVIATSTNKSDDLLCEFAEANSIRYFRGSESDVLSRIRDCLKAFKIDIHVEMMGDSPLPDPAIVDQVISFYLQNMEKYDYVSNDLCETYPSGLEVKVYPSITLFEAESVVDPNDPLREHVSIHMLKRGNSIRFKNLEAPEDLRMDDLFLEVDTKEDFEFLKELIEGMGKGPGDFNAKAIVSYIKANQHLTKINAHVHRRWKDVKQQNITSNL